MPSARTVKLILALIVVGGLAVLVGATVDRGTTAPPPAKITRQIMRRKDKSKLPASAAEIATLRKMAQDKEKRALKTREFKDMPLKYHVIRNVESETWYKDLQIEVKNIGTKPIYFILAYLEFPDHKPGGRDIGFDLTFGELKYVDIGVLADTKDPHINPGQTYVFTIPPKYARTLGRKHERAPQEFKKLDFHFGVISFGDGTGFEVGRPTDLKKPRPSDGGVNKKRHHVKGISVRAPPQDGCGSCGRYDIQFAYTCFNVYENEWCAPAPLINVNPSKPCRLYRTIYYDCDEEEGDECPRDLIYDSEICPGYTPPPDPTPTPESTPTPQPTCDPATKPNNSNCECVPSPIEGQPPAWDCHCFYNDGGVRSGPGANYHTFPGSPGIGGCDSSSNRMNNGGDCCVCAVTTCPEGSTLNWGSCQCESSGGSSGGGGGGNGGYPATYKRECVNYYWVHFVSYNDGETWEYANDETYAGCFYVN